MSCFFYWKMDSQLIRDNDVVPMGEPDISPPENKKKKIIIIVSVVGAIVLIIVITLTLVFTIGKKNQNQDKVDLGPLVYNSTSGNHTHTLIFMPGYSNQPEDFENVLKNKIKFSKKNDTAIIVLRSPLVNITFNHGKS